MAGLLLQGHPLRLMGRLKLYALQLDSAVLAVVRRDQYWVTDRLTMPWIGEQQAQSRPQQQV